MNLVAMTAAPKNESLTSERDGLERGDGALARDGRRGHREEGPTKRLHEPLPIEHSVSAVATDMYRSA